jgi:peptide/nickel transport system permease protein
MGSVGARAATLLTRVFLDALLPLAVAYAVISWLTDPARIDTGPLRTNSLLMNSRPIFRSVEQSDVFIIAIQSSAILLLTALAGAVVVGVPLGIVYGWSRNRAFKAAAWSLSTVLVALPAFFWAVALELSMIWIYLNLGVRFLPIAGFGLDEHLILPSLALGVRPAAYIFRLTASAVEEIRHTDYVRTANAKGLGERALLARHVLPNAAPNIIAAIVLAARGAISSLVIVEFVYIWGGAALVFVQALGNRRLELALAIAISFAIVSALLTFAAELAQSRVRVRAT